MEKWCHLCESEVTCTEVFVTESLRMLRKVLLNRMENCVMQLAEKL